MKFFIGLLLILIASPAALWFSESQHRVKDVSSATEVDASTQAQGYVVFEGEPVLSDAPMCPGLDQSCLAVSTIEEQYVAVELVECGVLDLDEGDVLLEQVEDRCDADTGSCDPCYQIERRGWEEVSDTTSYAGLRVGAYEVALSNQVQFVGDLTSFAYVTAEGEQMSAQPEEVLVGDVRFSYDFFPLSDSLLVVGEAQGGVVTDEGEKTFVVSSLGYEATVAELDARDEASKWGLRVLSLLVMVLGFLLVASQFLAPITDLAKIAPFLGSHISAWMRGVLYLVVAIAASMVWSIMLATVVLLKTFWPALLVLAVLIVFFGRLAPESFIKDLRQKMRGASGNN